MLGLEKDAVVYIHEPGHENIGLNGNYWLDSVGSEVCVGNLKKCKTMIKNIFSQVVSPGEVADLLLDVTEVTYKSGKDCNPGADYNVYQCALDWAKKIYSKNICSKFIDFGACCTNNDIN